MAVRKRIWLNSPYHNYTDRKKYKLSTAEIAQYTLYEEDNTHFNYGDFINSSCVTICPNSMLSVQPNYMILMLNGEIESRWYVNNFQYLSGEPSDSSKYTASLLRDVIVDINISAFQFKCKRGMLPVDQWSPTLVQPEGLETNAVKKDQKLLKTWDKDTQWLTIFYDVTSELNERKIEWASAPDFNYPYSTMQADYKSNGFTLTETGEIQKTYVKDRAWNRISIDGNWSSPAMLSHSGGGTFNIVITKTGIAVTDTGNYTGSASARNNPFTSEYYNQFVSGFSATGSLKNTVSSSVDFDKNSNYNNVRNKYQGQVIQNGSNYQRVSMSVETSDFSDLTTSEVLGAVQVYMSKSLTMHMGDIFNTTYTVNTSYRGGLAISGTSSAFNTSFVSVPSTGSLILPTWSQLDEIHLGCITIPFGPNCVVRNGTTDYQIDDRTIKNIITNGRTNSKTAIFDIQILPYCPSSRLNSLNVNKAMSDIISTSGLEATEFIPLETSAGTPMYYAFTCTQSSMEYTYSIDISDWFGSNIKLDSITKKLRLVAHNHKGIFEFNPTLNNGLNAISFKYTIRPFSTIFRICPVFKNGSLYGGEYLDMRGLIYEGGVSLGSTESNWTNFVMQNSTYQSAFDRDIKNMEISQGLAKAQATLNYETSYANAQTAIRAATGKAIASSVLGTLGGAVGGFVAGGPVGAAIGGIGGGTGGAISSGIGINAQKETAERNLQAAKQSQALSDSQRSENLAYKQDMFNLNIQAIQASPGSISATGEYSGVLYSPKVYIEFYDSTDEEKAWIETRFELFGMKIERFGSVRDFVQGDMSYLSGAIVFTNGLTPNFSNQINAELAAGIYVQGGLFND